MNYSFEPMTQEQAEEIAGTWKYEGEYAFYNIDADPKDLQEFLDPEERQDMYFTVIQNGEVVGFYSFTHTAGDTIDIGLGIRPDMTGNGKGSDFLQAGLDFAQSTYSPKKITLAVAEFNKRAIKVYENIGFKEIERFEQATNGSRFEFVKLIYYCKVNR